MPAYDFFCDKCKKTEEQILPMSQYNSIIKCDCGGKQHRIFAKANSNVDIMMKDNPRWSESMGINPDQIEEARKCHPHSTYDDEGRLLIKNRKHKLLEMKRRGYYD